MTGHTPTPWGLCHHLESAEKDASCKCGYRGGIWGNNGSLLVCEMRNCDLHEGHEMTPVGTRSEQLANAAFIVKACNAHEALVKALNDLHVWCEIEGCSDQAEIIKDAFIAAGITEHRCANCDGLGEWDEGPLPATSSAQISPDYRHMVCSDCEGKGTIALPATEGQGK